MNITSLRYFTMTLELGGALVCLYALSASAEQTDYRPSSLQAISHMIQYGQRNITLQMVGDSSSGLTRGGVKKTR